MSEYKMPIRPQESNKGTFGKVLNFAGSKNYIGAAYLSTLSALKIGAGYAALASEQKLIDTVSTMLPEAVYLTRSEALNRIKQFTVILIGCGLGVTNQSKNLLKKVLQASCDLNLPLVIDADGLNILAQLKNVYLPPNTIITPHPAEASRLLGTGGNKGVNKGVNIEEILHNTENAAKELSLKYNCITVLKTHRTIICNQRGEIFINKNGNSALAKAGTGDVLAGTIAGLLAQKMPQFEAAKLGVYLHSRSGEIASKELTEYSVLASDIIKYLPSAIAELKG